MKNPLNKLAAWAAARIASRNARPSGYVFSEKTLLEQKLEAEMLDRDFYATLASAPTVTSEPLPVRPAERLRLRAA